MTVPQACSSQHEDEEWMQLALAQAELAEAAGEVPVGAVLVVNGEQLAAGHNQTIALADPSAHAEMQALRAAGASLGNYRLPGTTLYVTLEPCLMCAGAIVHARVTRVVYAAADPKTGAAGGCFDLLQDARHNHRVEVTAGVLAGQSAAMLRAFFRARR